MEGQDNVIIAGASYRFILDKNVLKEIRGKPWSHVDSRFFIIIIISVLFHGILFVFLTRMKLKPVETVAIEQIPERFAKLIVDSPMPKKNKITGKLESSQNIKSKSIPDVALATAKPVPRGGITDPDRKQVQKTVASQVNKVEEKVRTVGVLGMLTGVGTTAKGPSVVDVLGTMKNKKGHFVDLDQALENMSGLQKNQNIEVLDRKLVKSKDIAISQKEEIDDLIASVGHAKTVDLSKKGDFVIQRPESIEGAASSDAKRDAGAINSVVSSHKLSIKMSYEKFLSRDPNLSGKITIKITIAASGSVTFVKAVENTTGSQELEEEIIRKISMWQFEPVPEGNVTITYPFVFMPSS